MHKKKDSFNMAPVLSFYYYMIAPMYMTAMEL